MGYKVKTNINFEVSIASVLYLILNLILFNYRFTFRYEWDFSSPGSDNDKIVYPLYILLFVMALIFGYLGSFSGRAFKLRKPGRLVTKPEKIEAENVK